MNIFTRFHDHKRSDVNLIVSPEEKLNEPTWTSVPNVIANHLEVVESNFYFQVGTEIPNQNYLHGQILQEESKQMCFCSLSGLNEM